MRRLTLRDIVTAIALVFIAPKAWAASSFELGTVLGGVTPTSTAPWLAVTFTGPTPGHVTLTLQSHLNVSSEFIGEVCLNINPAFSPASLTFSLISGPSLQGPPSLSEDGIRLSGAGSLGSGFDIGLNWPSGQGQNRFDGTEAATFDITGPADLTSSDFSFFNTVDGQDGSAIIGAHMQGIPLGGGATGSGVIIQNVPEPAAAAILAIALAAFGLCRGRSAPPPARMVLTRPGRGGLTIPHGTDAAER